MSPGPRAVFGIPAYEHAEHLPEALESLLSQQRRDFAIVVADDSASSEPGEIVARYARRDPRIVYRRNAQRLGMAANWRAAFELAREQFPEMEFFAWGSDHDVWHPRWLGDLVDALDADPQAVVAYPHSFRIDGDGRVLRAPWSFDTRDAGTPAERLARAVEGMSAGNMVYGLYRADALARAGVFRSVLAPDRLLLTELAVHGRFVQVPDVLWYRRYAKKVSNERQRATLFAGDPPAHTRLPWWMTHAAVFAWHVGVRGSAAPAVGRREAAALALRHAGLSARRAARSRRARIVKGLRRRRGR
ncbi:MAG TPA: glycosyltransferase family 2 protein [Solirubrobacteraceae bacterium]|jgi:glycosyltransferase involved in cell wall biosynthesis|nr:glycosyltransferase family 2 protein [Solirubrobacteraceae bacterium]